MVHQWATKGFIDKAWRPGRGSMMRPTINEESDCLRKKILRRRYVFGNSLLESFSSDYKCEYEYEIRQAKSMLYAYAIPY
jgi:hypothetical protein